MKRRLLEELPLIGASLVIAFVLWLIAKQGDLDSNWLSIPVQVVNIPPTMQIEASRPEVSIKAQFPAELRNDVLPKNFSLQIDATTVFDPVPAKWTNPAVPSTQARTLQIDMIVKSGLDPAVEVIEIDPSEIELTGKFYTKTVAIEIPTTGTLPANKEFTQPPRPEPAEIRVTGAPAVLDQISAADFKLKTAPINLSTLQGPTQLFPKLILPEGLTPLDLTKDFVTVNIGLIEKAERRTLPAIPVFVLVFDPTVVSKTTPAAVDVTLEGPPSALNAITPADLLVQPTKRLNEGQRGAQDVAVEAGLKESVPRDVARQVTIVECQPSRIAVEFSPSTVQNGDNPTSGPVNN